MGMIGNSLAQGLISGANIQDGTVDTPDIKDSAVTAAKIASGVVTPAKMDFTGGTANGVLYLNGSKVASSGSALVFDGTNLGIGTSSPSAKLHTYTGAATDTQNYIQNTVAGLRLSAYSDATTAVESVGASVPLRFIVNSSERMRIDSSGSVGVGGTLNSWGSNKAFQINGIAVLASDGAATWLANNWYLDGGVDKYISTAATTIYRQAAGLHQWYNAPSGTAGSAVSFTERMRLDTSGNLLVGITSSYAKVTINSGSLGMPILAMGDGSFDASAYGLIQVTRPATNDTKFAYCWIRNGNAIGGIGFAQSSNTAVFVNGGNNSSNGMTLGPGATSWGTQSDIRKKNILGSIEDALGKVSTLRTVFFEYKNDEEKVRRVGFIAQDVQAVLPEAVHVDDDPDNTLNLQYSDVLPLLTKAIQEQQAIIESLTQRITALETP